MAAEKVFPKANGDIWHASEANAIRIVNLEAGENLTAGWVVYIKKDDGKVYQSDTGAANDIRANGIVLDNVLLGNTAYVQLSGNYVTAGLAAGTTYYLAAAGAIAAAITGVQVGYATSATNLFIDIVQDDSAMVGTIKPWAKTIVGVPALTAFWIECDGVGNVNDAESPLDGQPVPDSNTTQSFLRGAAASGGVGGLDSITPTMREASGFDVEDSNNLVCHIDEANNAGAGELGSNLNSHTNIPVYYEVVFILKIK